ncbi:MAG TPA: hypothetical protein VFU05_15435 [Cyclobacteriaceae bacterium]|nr:hypothetical protein [Cyclobacteriaceae bacterium]
MKQIIVLMFVVGISGYQCEDESGCANLDWLNTIIEDAKQNPEKSEVIQYQYKLQTVYYVNTCICADGIAIVYNCSGEEVCKFGGFAGFNTCPDFKEKATNRKVIWSN